MELFPFLPTHVPLSQFFFSFAIILVSASFFFFTLAVLMGEVSCVRYTFRVWDPRSLHSILDVLLYFFLDHA